MVRTILRSAPLLALAVILGVPLAEAQSVYGIDGGASTVVEMTGPPGAPCPYPSGPVLSTFPTPAPFPCPLPLLPGPPPLVDGDIAVNRVTDTVWVTDGIVVGEYAASGPGLGMPLTGFLPAPFGTGAPLTGLGFDSAAGILWMTEGIFAQAVLPPPPPGCPGAGVVVVPPFALPLVAGARATDITWDPLSGTLFICDSTGAVTNLFPGGAPGPFGVVPVAPGPCGLAPLLQGIAFDPVGATMFGLPMYFVTDGFTVAHLDVGGAPAPPMFHAPAPCYPAVGPLVGLAYADRALPFGVGADNTALPPPSIGSVGQTLSPNPGFSVILTGSVPGSTAFLYLSTTGFYCPPPLVGTLPVYIDLTAPPTLSGIATVGAGGSTFLSTSIPPGFPIGVKAWLQWAVATPVPSLQVSEGLAVTTSLP